MRPAAQAFVPAFASPVYPAYFSPTYPAFLAPPVPSQLTQSCAVPGQGYGLIGQVPCRAPNAPYAPYGVYPSEQVRPAGQAVTVGASVSGLLGLALGAGFGYLACKKRWF